MSWEPAYFYTKSRSVELTLFLIIEDSYIIDELSSSPIVKVNCGGIVSNPKFMGTCRGMVKHSEPFKSGIPGVRQQN